MSKPLFLDAVIVADPRAGGDHLHDLESTIRSMIEAGWLVALLPVLSPVGPARAGLAPELAGLLRSGGLRLLSSSRVVHARLGLGFHVTPFLGEPDRQPRLVCDRAVLRIEQSWNSAAHHRICPLDTILDRAARLFGSEVALAPRSDAIELPPLAAPVEMVLLPAENESGAWVRGFGQRQGVNCAAAPSAMFSPGSLISPARVLMLSPNGIGMGHLTRQLAVARQLPRHIEPVFASMSQAVRVTEPFGFHFEYLPGPHSTGVDKDRWTSDFCQRLTDAVGFYDARALIFDGNFPYYALEMARQAIAERPMIWLRRGLWRKGAGRMAIERGAIFDLIIEPGDFARSMDVGPTSQAQDSLKVGPIILTPPEQQIERQQARQMLGLPVGAIAVLIQLGSGNNFAIDDVHKQILDHCAAHPEIHARCVTWLIASDNGNPCIGYGDRFRRLRGFPLSRFLNAFDFAVSAAGYNSFHELLSARLPTVFVPNENPIMDEQEARALYAERLGAAFYVPAHDPTRMIWALEQLRDPGRRAYMRQRMAALPRADGAAQAASLIALRALSINASRKSARIPRYLPRW